MQKFSSIGLELAMFWPPTDLGDRADFFPIFEKAHSLVLRTGTVFRETKTAQGVLVGGELEFEIDKFVAQRLKHQRAKV